MNVRIRSCEMSPTLAQSEFIRRRIEYALDVSRAEIEQIDVWIIGIEREGERRNYCKIDVALGNGNLVSTDGTETDFHLAVHRAADRAGWEVARDLGREYRQRVGTPLRPAEQSRNPNRFELAEAV